MDEVDSQHSLSCENLLSICSVPVGFFLVPGFSGYNVCSPLQKGGLTIRRLTDLGILL